MSNVYFFCPFFTLKNIVLQGRNTINLKVIVKNKVLSSPHQWLILWSLPSKKCLEIFPIFFISKNLTYFSLIFLQYLQKISRLFGLVYNNLKITT